MVTISSFVIVFLYTLVVSLVVCNARSRKSCFVAECVDEQTASCRALSNVNCLFPLFSSLLFPLFSSLFVKKGKGSFLPCVVVGFC